MTTDVSLEPVNPTPSVAKRKRGFTLTEIAIVLGIIGLILGAIWVAAAAVYNNLRVSHANTEVLQLTQGIRALYATTNTDAGLTTAALITAGAVPTDMISGAALTSPWPAGVTTVLPTGDGLGFYIQMTAVPRAACINLLMNVAGTNKDPGLFQATGAAAAGAAPAATGAALAVTATPALAAAAAAGSFGGCTAVTNVAQFGFALKS